MGYVLLVTVESKKPVQLWVTGWDTKIPNCVYFDRLYKNRPDGLFVGREQLRFSLPIEPEALQLRALDGQTGTANGIIIEKQVAYEPLNTTFTGFKRDDYDDFLLFSKVRAKYGGTWDVGIKKSPRGLWTCDVVDVITSIDPKNYGMPVDTPASIDHLTRVEFWVLKELHTRTVTNRMVIDLHEFGHLYFDTDDEFICDEFATQTAWSIGFGKYEIEATLIRLFGNCQCPTECDGENCKNCPCRERVERTEAMYDQLNSLPDLN